MPRATFLTASVVLTLVATLAAAGPIRVRMGQLHGAGGVPPGWKFTVPAGDPVKGKEVFAALECYACHIVDGQGFPDKATDKTGPQLTSMGGHHPAEYFAESLLDPNAVIVEDVPDWVGPDGLSKMPSYRESLTLEQWVNLVAYMKSLTGGERRRDHDASPGPAAPGSHEHGGAHAAPGGAGGHEGHAGHEMHGPEREKTIGEYRVRIDYDEPEADKRPGYLKVSVSDRASGQPIPYLAVRARIGSGHAARTVRLAPAIGPTGPHYGAAVVVPEETDSVTVLLGAATVPLRSVEPGKYRAPRQVPFEW